MPAYQSIVELIKTKFELQSLQTLVSESGSNCLTKSGDCACALGIRGLFWVLTVIHGSSLESESLSLGSVLVVSGVLGWAGSASHIEGEEVLSECASWLV